MKKIVLFIFLSILSFDGFTQEIQLSPQAEISIITVDPGHQLVDAFGHSAIRVLDRTSNIDQAYNYGTYNWNTPNFYGKFVQGKLLYDLASYPFHYFLRSYVRENRGVKEQILNLSSFEKQQFFNFLQNNAKPENKSYLYEFFYDNCATKLRDVTQEVLKDKVDFTYNFTKGKNDTFRDLIHQYSNVHPWSTFGIDLALGSIIDKKAEPKHYLFLPDYVFESYAESTMNNKPLVKQTKNLYTAKPANNNTLFFTPLVVFSLIALIVIWITFKDLKNNKRTKWLDFLLFFTTGSVGLIVLLMWFATDHTATVKNYNILWAFLPNLFIAFLLLKNELGLWLRKYMMLLIGLLLLNLILWVLKVQVFSIGIIPIIALLVVRYAFLMSSFNKRPV